MSSTEQDFARIVGDLQNYTITKLTLDGIRRIVDQGLSSRLVEQTVLTGLIPDQDKYQWISRIQTSLEKVDEADHSLACILMTDLWGLASDEGNHEVCNGIELWIWEGAPSAELENYLKGLSSVKDSAKRRHFQELIASSKASKGQAY